MAVVFPVGLAMDKFGEPIFIGDLQTPWVAIPKVISQGSGSRGDDFEAVNAELKLAMIPSPEIKTGVIVTWRSRDYQVLDYVEKPHGVMVVFLA